MVQDAIGSECDRRELIEIARSSLDSILKMNYHPDDSAPTHYIHILRTLIANEVAREEAEKKVAVIAEVPGLRQPVKVETFLNRLSFFIPKKYRAEALEDLNEDISNMRNQGLTEVQIRRRVLWQLIWLALANFRVWCTAAAGWIGWLITKLAG